LNSQEDSSVVLITLTRASVAPIVVMSLKECTKNSRFDKNG
jgi:hypothetical protein